MSFAVGDVVRDYTVTAVLGSGAFSDVYEVRSAAGGTLALKATRGRYVPLAVQEAAVLRYLGQAGASRVVGYAEDFLVAAADAPPPALGREGGDIHCLLTERLRGFTLDAIFRRSPGRAALVALAAALVRAVAEVHELGVAHRDIKPENIFVARGEGWCRLKLIDFGLACVDSPELNFSCWHPVGSRMWMAPELVHFGEPLADLAASQRADVWALGVTVHQLLHRGLLPYDADFWGTLPGDPMLVSQTKSAGDARVAHPAKRGFVPPEDRRFASRGPRDLPPRPGERALPAPREVDFGFGGGGGGGGGGTQSASYLASRDEHYQLPPEMRVDALSFTPKVDAALRAMLAVDPLGREEAWQLARRFAAAPELGPGECAEFDAR